MYHVKPTSGVNSA